MKTSAEELFWHLAAELQRSDPRIEEGTIMNGHGADTPMQVFSAGPAELNALVMFVVDATRPFSSPAKMP